jgi:hypothetical protein
MRFSFFTNFCFKFHIVGLTIFILYSHSSFLFAEDFKAKKIASVDTHVDSLLETGDLQPHEILIIFDVDGTLTDQILPNDKIPARPRGKSVTLVKRLKKKGIHLIASSAWKNFKGTLKRIRELGLSDAFEANTSQGHEIQQQEMNFSNSDREELIRYYLEGNIISVQNPCIDAIYYRQKAMAPYLVPTIREKLESRLIKRVLLVDDSIRNIEFFKRDVDRLKLYQGIEIDSFLLSPPYRKSRRLKATN